MIVPVEEFIDRPAGRPEALQVNVALVSVSVADDASGAMALPVTFDWSPGADTVTPLVIDQEKLVEPE